MKKFYILFALIVIVLVDFYIKEDYLINKYPNTYISENLKEYKKLTFQEYKHKKVKQFSMKIEINEKNLLSEPSYLIIVSDLNSLIYTNASYSIKNNFLIVKLNKNNKNNLYFNYKYDNPKLGEFRFNIISEFEYKYILPYEGILYGIAYGIIFSAFFYYLLIYLSSYKKFFLYYSVMQLFVLLSLIGFTYFSFQPYPDFIGQAIVDIFETLSYLFTLLFIKEILQTKKNMIQVDNLLNFLIILNMFDLVAIIFFKSSILYSIIPFYLIFLIASFAGIIAISKGVEYSKIYTLGWILMTVLIYIAERDISYISSIYVIHIAAPLESLIFSFALGIMLKNLVNKQNNQEKLLIHKSKLSSMGEMIDNIAHQWRQPLMHLGYINMNLELASLNDEFNKEYFVKKIKESNKQIKFMSQTIDDFGNFYKVEKEKKDFLISNASQLAINIVTPTIQKKGININFSIKNDSTIRGYENEYAQVILNLLTNCIDIFEARKTKCPKIDIEINNINKKSIIKVNDNAGGIDEEDLTKIFQANFSTKSRGSGIGLYMSKVIIQSHFDGEIYVYNNKNGACFKVEVQII